MRKDAPHVLSVALLEKPLRLCARETAAHLARNKSLAKHRLVRLDEYREIAQLGEVSPRAFIEQQIVTLNNHNRRANDGAIRHHVMRHAAIRRPLHRIARDARLMQRTRKPLDVKRLRSSLDASKRHRLTVRAIKRMAIEVRIRVMKAIPADRLHARHTGLALREPLKHRR